MHLPELATITSDRDCIRVGAAVRQAELLAWPELDKRQPLLAAALPWIGHAQTRSRGTVCGSVALADPSAELPLVMVALGGEVEVSSGRSKRRVTAANFFTGLMSTGRVEDELIEAVHLPCRQPGEGTAFVEFSRRHGDFAIVACAAIADADSTRLAVGGVADYPIRREFGSLDGDALENALAAFASDLDARDDLHATAEDRRSLVRRLGRQAIAEARRCRG